MVYISVLIQKFTHDGDADVISGDDGKLEIGKKCGRKNLHSLSRMRLYRELLDRLDTDYYVFLYFDNRLIISIGSEYVWSFGWMRAGYVLNDDGYIFMYHPKAIDKIWSQWIPFPITNPFQRALIPQHLPVEYTEQILLPNLSFLHFNIPSRDPSLNVRKTSAMFVFGWYDCCILTEDFLCRTNFSTLTRGLLFIYGECDNQLIYPTTVQFWLGWMKRTPIETVLSDFQYPFSFRSKIHIMFKINHCMKKLSATDYSDWFEMVGSIM